MILAGDIGAGKSVLGFFKKGETNQPPVLVKREGYSNQDYTNLEAMIRTFFQKNKPDESIYAACIGISGPVDRGEGKITGKLPETWSHTISEDNLCELLMELCWNITDKTQSSCKDSSKRMMPVQIINSLGAVDFGNLESQEELVELNQAAIPRKESEFPPNRAWIAPRSGLGEALLYWDRMEKGLLVSPSEGGHTNFAPRNKLETDLLNYLLDHIKPTVAYNWVLSTKGLVNIYQFLKDTRRGNESEEVKNLLSKENSEDGKANVIIDMGKTNKDALCTQTLDLFVSIYGAEAGNLALKYQALGGMYLGGTIEPRIIDKLRDGTFMTAFTDREEPKIKEQLSPISVKVVMNTDVRLWGAARRALRKESIGKSRM